MPLTAGTRLGPYEILAPIGAGGMGEVYRARDTRLKRDVALKVLPPAFARDPERMARFQREAEVLASLNHPNIAAIYGVDQSDDGTQALAMELVEGSSPKGPLPFEDAWKIAAQIADALEYAHDKGVVHRDLKPANVKVTPDGAVKLLDFGLAKAFSQQTETRAAGTGENSPTLTVGATEVGLILGTAGYMAPEQARGKAVDKRADIWSFGVVLYELLTGERLFKGEETADTLAQVLTKPPDFDKVPERARPLLEACLQKDPKQRLRDIGDAKQLLNSGAAFPPAAGLSPGLKGRGQPFAWIAVAILAVTTVASSWIAYRATRPAELKPLVRLEVDLGPDVALGGPSIAEGANAILSPDGTRMVYLSQGKLFTRKLDQPKGTELAGTDGASSPFFSPDGQWVAYYAQQNLRKISVDGGVAVTLCTAGPLEGGSWGEDGNIIATLGIGAPLSRIPSSGGAPTPITEGTQGELAHAWPQILPGGKAVLFTVINREGGNIGVMTLADRRRKTLVKGGTFGRYLAVSSGAGYLTYVSNGTLFAVPFDMDTLAVRGTPSPVLEQVDYNAGNGSAQLDFSRNGTVVYHAGPTTGASALSTVQWLDGAGKTQPLLAKPGAYIAPHLSPDGERLALTMGGSTSDIWIYDWRRDTMTRLTFNGGNNPIWSPDGRYIVFEGRGGMFWIRSDGSSPPQPLTQSKARQVPFSFAPGAKRLAFFEFGPGRTNNWTVPLESDGSGLRAGKPEAFQRTTFVDRHPVFSPDGRWLAYDSNESGTTHVYVRAFPDKGGKWQISNTNGIYPEWSRGGRELFFRTDENRIMVASYTVNGDSFVADKPRLWSEKPIGSGGPAGTNYSLGPDGKRIAALMPVQAPDARQSQSHVIFLENFVDELRRKVPVSGK